MTKTAYFTKPYGNRKYGEIKADLNHVFFTLEFNEAIVIEKSQSDFDLFVNLVNANGLADYAGKPIVLTEPVITKIPLSINEKTIKIKNGEKYDDVTFAPSPFEKILIFKFKDNKDLFLNPNKGFKGVLKFDGSSTLQLVYRCLIGMATEGEKAALPSIWSEANSIQVEACELTVLKDFATKQQETSNGNGYKGGNALKWDAKLSIIKTVFKDFGIIEDDQIPNKILLSELSNYYDTSPDEYRVITDLLEILFNK